MNSLLNSKSSELWARNYQSICNAPLISGTFSHLSGDNPLNRLNDLWKTLKAVYGGGMPKWVSFKPQTLGADIRWLLVFDNALAGQDACDPIVKLAGTAVEVMAGSSLKGRRMSDFTSAEAYPSRQQLMSKALGSANPQVGGADMTGMVDQKVSLDVGFFPFMGHDSDNYVMLTMAIPRDPALRRFI